ALVTPKEMTDFYKKWVDIVGNTEDILFPEGGDILMQEDYNALILIEPEEKTEKLTRDVALEGARPLQGTVAGPDGKPLTGVRVSGLLPTRDLFGQETLKTADFTVGGLNPKRSRELFFLHKEKGLGFYGKIRG